MQVVPKDGPAPVPGQLSEAQKSAEKRQRAVNAFMGKKDAQQAPVSNPTNVAPEELGAIKAPTPESDEFSKALASAKTQEDGQTQVSEAKASEVTPEKPAETATKPENPLSTQYAQLARKERALRAQAQELKKREDALKAKEQPAPTSQPSPIPGIPLDEFKKNPWKYMQEAGVTYDQVTQQALNAPSHEQAETARVIDELRNEIKALKDDQSSTKKSWEDNQKNQYQQAISQIKNEVTHLVNSNEDFETVKATGSVNDVVQLIEKTFQEDGILLSVEDAAKQVEDYLVEEAYKLSQLKKIQKRLQPSATAQGTPPKAAEGVADKQSQKTPTTLSNTMTSSRQLSARERAIAAGTHGPNWREKI